MMRLAFSEVVIHPNEKDGDDPETAKRFMAVFQEVLDEVCPTIEDRLNEKLGRENIMLGWSNVQPMPTTEEKQ